MEPVDLPGAVEDQVQTAAGAGAQVDGDLVAGLQQAEVAADAGLVGRE
ncbi:hypothetical protein [Streptomyces sp. NPDC054940]